MKDKLGLYLERKRREKVLPWVHGHLLDIGCGMNHLLRQHKTRDQHILSKKVTYGTGIGVDVHKWHRSVKLIKNSGKLPFKNETFDTVTIIATLNHIPNRKQALKEAHRVLRTYGSLIITMIPPKFSKTWHHIRKRWDADQRERGMKKGEIYGMTKQQIRNLVQPIGFEPILIDNFMLINQIHVYYKKPR